MSDIVSFDHHGVMVTIFRVRGQYGYRLRHPDGRKLVAVTGFVSIAVAEKAARARASEIAQASRGAA